MFQYFHIVQIQQQLLLTALMSRESILSSFRIKGKIDNWATCNIYNLIRLNLCHYEQLDSPSNCYVHCVPNDYESNLNISRNLLFVFLINWYP